VFTEILIYVIIISNIAAMTKKSSEYAVFRELMAGENQWSVFVKGTFELCILKWAICQL